MLIFCGQITDKYFFISHDKYRRTNKKLDVDSRPGAKLCLLSALGAIGPRLECCNPDSNNSSHRSVS